MSLIKEEGTKLEPYRDQRGLWTIGVGHLLRVGEEIVGLRWSADGTPSGRILLATADLILARDLHRFERAINARGWALWQEEFDALVSLIFNTGEGALDGVVGHELDEADYLGAARGFLLWRKGWSGLAARRVREFEAFTGQRPTADDYAAVGLTVLV